MARPAAFVVAIAGGSASGKTCFARDLAEALSPLDAAIIEEDAYYHPSSVRGAGDVTTYNFDRPETKDFALLSAHLMAGRAGGLFVLPHYDFASHDRTDQVTEVPPCDVLILEGLHNLTIAEVRALADLTVFVEAGTDLRRARRVARDVAERGRLKDDTERQFDAVVEPMHQLHVEPQKHLAARVVVNEGDREALRAAAMAAAADIKKARRA
jgi:uridine kinase